MDDVHVAMGTLASVDWNLEEAISAQLSVPDDDDEPIVVAPSRPNIR